MSTPVAPAMTARRGLWRWAVALAATVALIVSGSGLVVFAQSGSSGSQGPVFVPADTPIYIEARLDMPDGQDKALAQMMTAFPGFADPGTFQMKVDELLSGMTGSAAPEGDIIGDVLTGEIGIAVRNFEAAMANEEPTVLMGMAIADPAMAEQMAESLASGEGMEGMEALEDMAPTQMVGDTAVVSDMTSSAAIHGDWMLFSNDAEQVAAAIEVLDGNAPSLADDPDFAAAFARVPSAHLGAAYLDMQSFGSFIDMAGTMAGAQAGMELPMGDLAAMLPKDMVMYLAAEDDRMNLEALVTPGEATPPMPVGSSLLSALYPSDTQAYWETRELGATVETALTGLSEMMAAQEAMLPADDSGTMSEIEMLFSEESPITSMLGAPLPEVLDFVGDASIGMGLSSDGLWMGIAGEVIDGEVAEDRVSNIISLIRLFGADPELGMTVDSEVISDVEVTTLTLPVDEMTAQAGLPVSVGDTVSVAVTDSYLLIGLGDFVQSALTADGSDSLTTNPDFLDALGGDTVNSGVVYVDISSLLTELGPMISMMSPEWAEIEPFAAGLDRMIAVGTVDDEVFGVRMSVIVGQ